MKAKLVKENLGDILKPKLKEDIIKQLSNLCREEKEDKLFNAIYDDQLEIVKYLIEAGVNINAKDKDGDTALMLASIYNNLNMVKYLIEKGANINYKNVYGQTASLYAIDEDIMELLKRSGAK